MSDSPEKLPFSEKRAVGSAGLARAPGLLFVAGGLGVVVAMIAANDLILVAAVLLMLSAAILAAVMRQRATQQALRESEARFRALSALGSDWYWESDAEYRLTHVSEGLARLSGRAISEFLGKPRWHNTFVTPVGAEWTIHKTVISRRAPFRDLVLRYVSPQGMVAYGSVSGEPVFSSAGILEGYRGVGNDVTAEVVLDRKSVV